MPTHLEFAEFVDEQILGFEISVKYSSGMAIGEAADQLEQEELQEKKREGIVRDSIGSTHSVLFTVTYPVNRRTTG